MPRRRWRLLDLIVAIATAGLVVGGVGLGRAVIATADSQPPPPPNNPDLVQPCGAGVVLVVDRGVPGGPGPVVERVANSVSGSGSRLAVISYDGSATIATPPPVAGTDTAPLVTVDGAALAPGGPVRAIVDQVAATPPGSGHDWAEALTAAETVLSGAGTDPVLVLHVAAALPGSADATTTTQPGAALDPARAVADRLRARPATHLLTVAAGHAELAEALKVFAGPNVTVDGTRLTDVSTDDVVTVPTRDLDAVAAEIAGDLCATDIRLHATDAAGAGRTGAPLTLEVAGGATVATPVAPSTDGAGNLRWRLRSPFGTTFSATIADPATSGTDRTLICAQGGAPVSVTATDAARRLDGLVAGKGVVCELRNVATSASLTLSYGIEAGDSACGNEMPAALVAVMGDPVSHCLRLTNPNRSPVTDVVVGAIALGLSADAKWVLGEPLAAGATVERRIVVPAGRSLVVDVTASGRLGDTEVIATASGSVTPAPPALTVDRAGPGDGAMPCPGAGLTWCVTVTNTGGTYLEQLSVRDAALSEGALALTGRLAPGEKAALGGTEAINGAVISHPVATALPVDALGEPVAGTVSSAPLADGGLAATQVLSSTEVAPGSPVSATITVTNTGAKPAEQVAVRNTLCGEMGAPSSRLADNGNATLENGEAWVYTCSTPVVLDTVAMGVVVAQDEGPVNTRPGEIITQKPDLAVKKRQRTDLRVGSETRYEIEVINNGAIEAPNVVVTDQLPAGVTFLRANVGSCSASGATVTCSLGTLPPQDPGQEVLIQIFAQATPAVVGQTLKNTVSASTSGAEQNLGNNSSFANGRVDPAGVCTGRDCPGGPTDTTPSTLTPATIPQGGGGAGSGGGGGAAPEVDQATRGGVAGSGGSGSSSGGGGSGSGGSGTSAFATTGANSATTAGWALLLLASGLVLTATGRRRLRLAAG